MTETAYARGNATSFITSSYPLRVAYDAQAFLSPNGGTGKGLYLRNLIAQHAKDFVGLATRGGSYFEYPLVQRGLSRYHPWHQLSVPRILAELSADLFLAPYNTAPLFIPRRTKLVLVLHDLILLEDPQVSNFKQRVDNQYRKFLIPRAVSRSSVVITVSNYVKGEISRRFPAARVEMIPNTIAPSWFVGETGAKRGERGNYILAVASSAPHKNAQRALVAYADFVATRDRSSVPHLRIVGFGASGGAAAGFAESLRVSDLVHFEPFLSEFALQSLYRDARALLIPSLMEGFGIPVLEAMASGTPVIASNTTSLPEVGGDAAEYFDPTDVVSMTAAMDRVLSNPQRRQDMSCSGLAQAQRFHPENVGRRIRAFWDEIAKGILG